MAASAGGSMMAAAARAARAFKILVARSAAEFEGLGNVLADRFLHFLHGLLRIDEIAGDWIVDQGIPVLLEFSDFVCRHRKAHLLLVLQHLAFFHYRLVLQLGGFVRHERIDSFANILELWLVDDGLATGSTMRAAVAALKQQHPARVVVAVPVASPETCQDLRGEADEVVVRVPVGRGSAADGASLAQLQLETETGFYLLAIRRGGRYFYRPRKAIVLAAGDELIATGPDEGHALLAQLCGYRLIEDEDTGTHELVQV